MKTRSDSVRCPGFLYDFPHAMRFKGGGTTVIQQPPPAPPPPPPAPEPPPAEPPVTDGGTNLPPPEPPANSTTVAPPASDKSSEVRDANREARKKAGRRRGYLSTLLANETGGAQGQAKTLLGQ
jgi:hypothetical protein